MDVECTWRFTVSSDKSGVELSRDLDSLMNELLAIEELDPLLSDTSLALDNASGSVEIAVRCVSTSREQGMHHIMSAIRSAIHAAGGATPGLPESFEDQDPKTGLVLENGELVVS